MGIHIDRHGHGWTRAHFRHPIDTQYTTRHKLPRPKQPHRNTNQLTRTNPDANDESLRKWKESLGLGTGDNLSDPSDPRKVIIFSLGLEVEGRSDIIIDLTKRGALEDLNKHPFTIKEGATFRMKARFKVQHQILSGMKYVQVVSRMGVKNKMQEMIVRLPDLDL